MSVESAVREVEVMNSRRNRSPARSRGGTRSESLGTPASGGSPGLSAAVLVVAQAMFEGTPLRSSLFALTR